MGKCVKCGKETGHIYEYYTGDFVGSKRLLGGGPGVKYTVERTYENITHVSDFLCVRCSHISFLFIYGLFAMILLIFSLPNIFLRLRIGRSLSNIVIGLYTMIGRIPFLKDLQAISRTIGENRDLLIPFSICGIAFLIMFLFNCYSVIQDKPVSKLWGSRISVACLKKRIKNKTLFTVEQRKKLRKNYPG
jgi:hypothetical protein